MRLKVQRQCHARGRPWSSTQYRSSFSASTRSSEAPHHQGPVARSRARACASVGLNGAVLNNVNADAQVLTAPFLRKVAAIADTGTAAPAGFNAEKTIDASGLIVAPGLVDTPLARTSMTDAQRAGYRDIVPLGRIGEPEDIAPIVAFLLSDASGWMTGQTLHANGGMLMA